MKNKRKGTIMMCIGMLLIVASLSLFVYNRVLESRVETTARTILEQLEIETESADSEGTPAYVIAPELEMPTKKVDGRPYIGILQMPTIGKEMPIMSAWSYPNLKTAPCRYSGSAYEDNLVIAGHNYRTHFGPIDRLSGGDEVIFTDMDGNVFRYRVGAVEVLDAMAIEDMTSGEWDLTLFTCNYSGRARITVRCERITPENE